MRIYKCDKCGETMYRLITVTQKCDAVSQSTNVADMYPLIVRKIELCEQCYDEFLLNLVRENNGC